MKIFQSSRYTSAFALVIVLTITAMIYRPGLNGPFMFDDAPNIINNNAIAINSLETNVVWKASFSGTSGPLGRPLSMLSFALNYYASGFNNFGFKVTNVVIHLLCGVGIFLLSLSIFKALRVRAVSNLTVKQSHFVCLTITAAWLLHPLCLTSVLYVVQRMTSLASLFCIYGLISYLHGRIKLLETGSGKLFIAVSFFIFTPLAILSKETGALLPLLLLATEVSILNFETQKSSDRTFLLAIFSFFIVLPSIAALAEIIRNPDWILASYSIRDFTLLERLITESRVLCFYLKLILVPSINDLGLFHDDIAISQGLWEPATTLLSIILISSLLVGALYVRKKVPILSFGILFFFTGHLLESTIFGLEIAHEHRNYLPMYGPIFAAFYYLLNPLKFADLLTIRRSIAALLLVLFSVATFSRSSDWANPYDLYSSEMRHHPNSARINLEMANMLSSIETKSKEATKTNYLLARSYYEKSTELNPNFVNGLIGLIQTSSKNGNPIESVWMEKLTYRLKNSPLAANTTDQLITLVTCQMEGICKLPNQQLENLLMASLENKTVTKIRRASLLSAYSYYLINISKDYPKAIQIMLKSIEESPKDLDYRLNFIKFAIATGYLSPARTQIDEFKKVDLPRKYAEEIEEQSKNLKQASVEILESTK